MYLKYKTLTMLNESEKTAYLEKENLLMKKHVREWFEWSKSMRAELDAMDEKEAEYFLGLMKQSYEENKKAAEKHANTEQAQEWYLKGRTWDEDSKGEVNLKEAFHWYLRAAEAGHVRAQSWVGYCYQYGRGVSKNDIKAFEWYEKAANQGDAYSQNKLGTYFHNRRIDIPAVGREAKPLEKAVEWFKKSAEAEFGNAQSWMGYCYQYGKGVPEDTSKAFEWYEKAAKKGEKYAQDKLAGMRQADQGAKKDTEKATDQDAKKDIEKVAPQKPIQKLVTENSQRLFDMTGIIYMPEECKCLTEDVLKPYMDRVTIIHMHKNVKFIDGQALRKCKKLEKVDFGFVEGVYNPHYEIKGKQLFDRKTNERIWP